MRMGDAQHWGFMMAARRRRRAAVKAIGTPVLTATQNSAYAGFTVAGQGGASDRITYDYALVGTWPSGLSVDANGDVSGTPTVAGTFPGLSVSATDSIGKSAQLPTFTLVVAAP